MCKRIKNKCFQVVESHKGMTLLRRRMKEEEEEEDRRRRGRKREGGR